MFLIDSSADAVTVNGGATASYLSVGSDGINTADEGLLNVARGHAIRNTRIGGSSERSNQNGHNHFIGQRTCRCGVSGLRVGKQVQLWYVKTLL